MKAHAPKAAFPLSDAATHAETDTITLRGIETIINNDQATQTITEDLPTLSTEIDSRLDESAGLLSSSPSLQVLGQQEEDWGAILRELNDWKRSLDRRLTQIKQADDQLTSLKSQWDSEEAVVKYWSSYVSASDVLETAQNTVDQIQLLIDQTIDDRRNSFIQTFATQQAVDAQHARVLEVLDSVRQAREEAFNRLLVRNSPPLWSIMHSARQDRQLVQQGQDSFDRQVKAMGAYLQRRHDNVGGQILLLLVLVIALYVIRHRTRKWAAEQPELEHAARVFNSPIATALVLSLLLSVWFYPQAPRLLWAIIGAAALIPTIIILRQLLDRRWFTLLYALVVFYFLDQLRSITAVMPFVSRILLLVEMLGGFLLLLSFKHAERNSPAASPVIKLVRLVGWLWMAVFFLAFLGDLVGYVSLAGLMGDAALGSLYLAVILYACALIVSGLFVLALHSRPLCLLTMVRQHLALIQRRFNLLLTWTALAAWAVGVLASLSVATSAYELARKTLGAELVYGKVELSLGKVLAFVVAMWASVWMSRFIRFVLEEDIYDRFALSGGISYAISKMVNYIILLLGFFFAVSSLGYDLTTFAVLGSAFAVGLGFGMQNIVNNFVSGLILLFERPVKVGDVIQMDDTTGVVGHIGIRASIIRTNNSAEIIVPNGNLISGKVINWTLSNRQRGIEINLAVGAGADPKHVMQLLKEVACVHPLIIKIPPPEAFLISFAGDSFTYLLRVWTNNAEQWISIRSEISIAIHAALVKENITIK